VQAAQPEVQRLRVALTQEACSRSAEPVSGQPVEQSILEAALESERQSWGQAVLQLGRQQLASLLAAEERSDASELLGVQPRPAASR
jgi:hypothetical protein